MTPARVRVELTDVSETALWNLHYRAAAARAGYLDDGHAVEMAARLIYPSERFSSPYGGLAARMHAVRVGTVDTALRRLLSDQPQATIVALGEGFETQFWRVDNGRMRWLTVDLPDVIAVRRQVLPAVPRAILFAGSAAQADWVEEVDRDRPVIITAQGLLMYFDRDQVHGMLTDWAHLLPGAQLVFDAVTPALQDARRRRLTGESYQPPRWRWTLDAAEADALRMLSGVRELNELSPARATGLLGLLQRAPFTKGRLATFPVFHAVLG